MRNVTKMLIIIPSYICDNHCAYCMYHDLTYNNTYQSVDTIIDQVNTLIASNDFYGYAVGGGGNILKLGYDYCEQLIAELERIIPSNKTLTLMTNINNSDDVVFLEKLATNHRVRFNISINFERPNNERTIELIKSFSASTRSKIRISVVVLNSIIQLGPQKLLSLIDQLGVEALLINQFEQTSMTKINSYPTDYQYFYFLKQCIEQWQSNDSYCFDLPQCHDLKLQCNLCGLVDVIIDPFSVKIATLDENRVKHLITVSDINQVDKIIKASTREIFDPKCMMCKRMGICEHKYTQHAIDDRVCMLIDQMTMLVQ